jgi:hypothetical protein
MPINFNINKDAVREVAERKLRAACVAKLQYIGLQCVREARLKGSYVDQTGNLRSSTGFVISDGGNIVVENGFEQVKNGTDGTLTGRALAHSLATKYGNDLVLIIVAGMNYAVHVQNRGRDVLVSAEVLARQLLKQ